MADSDKNILITPNIGSTSDPTIQFTGGDNNPITLTVLDNGTLSFSGSSGQLFSVSDSLTGTIFSVNDVSGIPSIEVEDDGTIRLAEFAGNVGIGVNSPSYKLDIAGNVNFTGTLYQNGTEFSSGGVEDLPIGTENTAAGTGVLASLTSTSWGNTGVGHDALSAVTSGRYNTAVGQLAAITVSTSSYNTVVGASAWYAGTGPYNTVMGALAGRFETTANGSTLIGYRSGFSTTTGGYNTAIGYDCLYTNTTGSTNTAVGREALYFNSIGIGNIAIGNQTAYNADTGNNNIAIGFRALYNQNDGSENVVIGHQALYSQNSPNGNTMIGYRAGYDMLGGYDNTIIGHYTGNQNGLDIRFQNTNIVLSAGDGVPRLYYQHANTTWFSPTIRDKTTASSANMFIDGTTGAMYRSTSSLRYKNTINDAIHGLKELMELRPVTYKGNEDGDKVFGGLIAEEVHDAGLTEFVQYTEDGQPDALAYGNMVSLCIKAIQEQQETIKELQARIAVLENS